MDLLVGWGSGRNSKHCSFAKKWQWKFMVFRWDEYWGIIRWFVLYSDSVVMKLVCVYKGLLHLISLPYFLIKYKYCCLSGIRIFICCGCLYNCHNFDHLLCIREWTHITLFTCVVHDGAIGSTYNIVRIRFQFYLALYNGPSDFHWELTPSYIKARSVVSLSRV